MHIISVIFQSLSVECGLNTACIKIFKPSEGFDENGVFIPLHRRNKEVMLFRGELNTGTITSYCHNQGGIITGNLGTRFPGNLNPISYGLSDSVAPT